jgi:hypothetical protein
METLSSAGKTFHGVAIQLRDGTLASDSACGRKLTDPGLKARDFPCWNIVDPRPTDCCAACQVAIGPTPDCQFVAVLQSKFD